MKKSDLDTRRRSLQRTSADSLERNSATSLATAVLAACTVVALPYESLAVAIGAVATCGLCGHGVYLRWHGHLWRHAGSKRLVQLQVAAALAHLTALINAFVVLARQ
jgi:hypothetical protein